MALLSNSFILVASLHAQILVSEGTITSYELVAFSKIMIGNALAPWPMRPTTVVVGSVWVPAKFLAAVDELDLLLIDY